ncbi:hypothetical protein NQ315_007887 [Exocentrus adspersus]|uniref:Uncharacterized protein n=1 Tax=Exocentrus adspersus TaxID=1586481 RepID=A0AAV8W9K0_9CUCU|nr:hypothetical protein NQ315_007887 [Exocentrus adspersus]
MVKVWIVSMQDAQLKKSVNCQPTFSVKREGEGPQNQADSAISLKLKSQLKSKESNSVQWLAFSMLSSQLIIDKLSSTPTTSLCQCCQEQQRCKEIPQKWLCKKWRINVFFIKCLVIKILDQGMIPGFPGLLTVFD